jgi:hypothetical protein
MNANDATGRSLKWIHLLSHSGLHFTNSSMGQVVCVKGKFLLLQNVHTELKCQLAVYRAYRVTNSAHTEHL